MHAKLIRENRYWQRLIAVILFTSLLLALPAMAQAAYAPADSDPYEVDNSCEEAKEIAGDGSPQRRNLFRDPDYDIDWVKINAAKDQRYVVEARPDGDEGADLSLRMNLYARCGDVEFASGSEKLEFKAFADGAYYLQIRDRERDYGEKNAYTLKVSVKQAPPKTVPLSEAPVEIMRRAADFVEEMRGSELAPNWANARFSEQVRVLFRPDMEDEPAYYEFPLEAPDSAGAYQPAGFVQLAAGDHDYPITHWNVEGQSPTQSMDETASLNDFETVQYFKLDALAYTAEYDEPAPLGVNATVVSTDVMRIGTLPTKLVGDLEIKPLDGTPLITEISWDPGLEDDADADPDGPISLPIIDKPDYESNVTEENWDSWDQLKNEYASTYAPLLEDLKKTASDQWTEEAALSADGEGLIVGDVRTVRALPGKTVSSIDVSGEGSDPQYVKQENVAADTLPEGVMLTVVNGPTRADESLPLQVTIAYGDGSSEVQKFVVINNAANNIFLPLVASPQSVGAASTDAQTATSGSWSAWTYWWAGTSNDQRLYDQIPKYTSPNNTGCWSGCGATAWAMLFGWADYRASVPGSGWNHRWGIYRTNGGYGANAVAPRPMYGASESPGIHNVMMEVRGYIKTWCNSGSGWTKGSDMHNAYKYLTGRTGAKIYSKSSSDWWTSETDVRNHAINVVKSGRPVVIGRASHFPLAYGYAERHRKVKACSFCWWSTTQYSRWFYVNQGWGGSSNGWVSAEAWYAGEIKP